MIILTTEAKKILIEEIIKDTRNKIEQYLGETYEDLIEENKQHKKIIEELKIKEKNNV